MRFGCVESHLVGALLFAGNGDLDGTLWLDSESSRTRRVSCFAARRLPRRVRGRFGGLVANQHPVRGARGRGGDAHDYDDFVPQKRTWNQNECHPVTPRTHLFVRRNAFPMCARRYQIQNKTTAQAMYTVWMTIMPMLLVRDALGGRNLI